MAARAAFVGAITLLKVPARLQASDEAAREGDQIAVFRTLRNGTLLANNVTKSVAHVNQIDTLEPLPDQECNPGTVQGTGADINSKSMPCAADP
jgi:hypothetical protein